MPFLTSIAASVLACRIRSRLTRRSTECAITLSASSDVGGGRIGELFVGRQVLFDYCDHTIAVRACHAVPALQKFRLLPVDPSIPRRVESTERVRISDAFQMGCLSSAFGFRSVCSNVFHVAQPIASANRRMAFLQ
jgi:hypothetical protein